MAVLCGVFVQTSSQIGHRYVALLSITALFFRREKIKVLSKPIGLMLVELNNMLDTTKLFLSTCKPLFAPKMVVQLVCHVTGLKCMRMRCLYDQIEMAHLN